MGEFAGAADERGLLAGAGSGDAKARVEDGVRGNGPGIAEIDLLIEGAGETVAVATGGAGDIGLVEDVDFALAHAEEERLGGGGLRVNLGIVLIVVIAGEERGLEVIALAGAGRRRRSFKTLKAKGLMSLTGMGVLAG